MLSNNGEQAVNIFGFNAPEWFMGEMGVRAPLVTMPLSYHAPAPEWFIGEMVPRTSQSTTPLSEGRQTLDVRCCWLVDPSTGGCQVSTVPTKTRIESRIKSIDPHLIYFMML